MADVSQIKLPNGSVYDLIDEKSGYITAEYIENKTDYSIPVSRVGEIEVGETAIGTDSTNFPTSKAVVDYVDERVVQEMDAIDVGVTGIKANGTSLAIENGVVNIPVVSETQLVGLMTAEYMERIYHQIRTIGNEIPTSTSQLTNDSGFITNDSDEKLKTTTANSDTTYYPILGTNNTNSSSTKVIDTYALSYDRQSSNHRAYLRVGTSSGTEGRLTLSSTSTGSVTIAGGSATSHRTVTLPDKTGTVALTSDIPTVPTNISSFTNDSGYLTASDIASVMTYKGTKANYAALPASGNTTGDVWHLTDTGAEWAWDGSAWQELGTAIDLSSYATKATTLAGYGITDAKIENGTITLGSNTITPLTSFTETDPVFSASAAAGITSTDISNWNGKSSTDEKLAITQASFGANQYYPIFGSGTSAQTRLYDSNFCYQPSTDYAILTLGNTETGTKIGNLNLCYQNYVVWLQPTVLTNHRSIYLPDKGGTIALTSDIPVNTNTTYTLSNALASHKFTSTLTAGGSGSGTSTATMEFVAGTGITLTDDTTNKKITIASSVVNTDEKVKTISYSADDTGHPIVFNTTSNAATTETKQASSNFTFSANSSNYYTLRIGVSASAKGRIWINTGGGNSGNGTYLVSSSTDSKTLTLPDATGTLALASQIPSIYNSSTNPSGYLTMATLPIYDGTVV